jgi:SecD/SecF fusion protein
VLKLMNATFSLAAIAGFILSAGMAIDANILVFERLKEEIRNGKTVDKAMRLGFKHALSAIADSNACTIITSLVLVSFGTGAVKGFAVTLVVGVVISFITAFFFTRAILTGLYSLGIGRNEKSYALKRAWFGENLEAGAESRTLPIVLKSKTWFLISIALIIPGLIALGMGGIKQNVEFQGGYQAQFVVPQGGDLTVGNAQKKLEDAGFPGANVKFSEYEGKAYVDVTVPAKGAAAATAGEELNAEAKDKLATALGTTTEGASFSSVGPTVQRETWEGAIKMVLYSTILIVLYLTIRFGIAVGGHDVVFVVGLSAIVGLALNWEISALFLTSMLTVIGFSVHDTIVMFDRIRENLQKTSGNENLETIVDRSVTQTVARSINTSMMTIVQLGILIAIGTPTPDLKFMCVTMLAGIVIGTYSSIFNASPFLYFWDRATMKRKGEAAGLVAEAEREAKLRAQQALAGLQAAPAGAASTAGVMNPTGQSGPGYATIKRRTGVQPIKKKDEDEE